MSGTQVALDPELQLPRGARQSASDLGVMRRLVARTSVFDLGSSTGSDVAKNKNEMIAAAFASACGKHD